MQVVQHQTYLIGVYGIDIVIGDVVNVCEGWSVKNIQKSVEGNDGGLYLCLYSGSP